MTVYETVADSARSIVNVAANMADDAEMMSGLVGLPAISYLLMSGVAGVSEPSYWAIGIGTWLVLGSAWYEKRERPARNWMESLLRGAFPGLLWASGALYHEYGFGVGSRVYIAAIALMLVSSLAKYLRENWKYAASRNPLGPWIYSVREAWKGEVEDFEDGIEAGSRVISGGVLGVIGIFVAFVGLGGLAFHSSLENVSLLIWTPIAFIGILFIYIASAHFYSGVRYWLRTPEEIEEWA